MIELADYEYLERLGEPGFFGEAWLARNRLSGRMVAVKHIDGGKIELSLEAWSAEAEAMAACEHENLVTIHHAEVTDDGPALVLEYLPDGSAVSRWGGTPAPIGEAMAMAIEVCWGLHHLHIRDLTHRDIKPGNILFRGDTAVLADFGLAVSTDTPVSTTYKPHTPPEVRAGGHWTPVADVFALGVTLYRLICGDAFCEYDSPEILDRIARGWWPDLTLWPVHVHKRLRTVLRAAMNPDPNKRPQSAAALRNRLEMARPAVSFGWDGVDRWAGASEGAVWRIRLARTDDLVHIDVERDLGRGLRRVSVADAADMSEVAAKARLVSLFEQLAISGGVAKGARAS